jgi:uncharacterized protein (DUF4415 family)
MPKFSPVAPLCAARGGPKSGAAKEQISVRLDPAVLAKLREAGPGWQTQINSLRREALRIEAAL